MSDSLSASEPVGRLVEDSIGEIDHAACDATPDFAEVLGRARRLAPQRFDRSRTQLARRLDRLPNDELRRLTELGDLQTLVDDARAELADATDAAESGPAPLPLAPPRTGSTRIIAAALMAVAAVVLTVGALGYGLRSELVRDAGDAVPSAASRAADTASTITSGSSARTGRRERPAPASESPDEPERVEDPQPVVEPAPTQRSALQPAPRRAKISLDVLDAEARRAWKAGDLSAAERAFREIVQRGGRSKLADLAYGDLFELARQRGKHAEEARLWRAYLRRFPRGSYADDARAGLCRLAQGDEAVACWNAYLEERPRGTYRAHAQRVLERARKSH